MKLITNKPYDSLFVYFPGIDDPDGWTEDNPKVYKSDYDYIVQKDAFVNTSSDPQFFLFGVLGGVDYHLHGLNDVQVEVLLYDYLDYSSDDVEKRINARYDGIVGKDSSLYIKEEDSATFLAVVIPYKYFNYNINTPAIILSLSNPPVEIDCSSHYARDWQHRIDGTCWNIAGKVRDSECLYDIDRRHMPAMGVLPAWRNGVYCTQVPCSEFLNGNFEGLFDDAGAVIQSGMSCDNVSRDCAFKFTSLMYYEPAEKLDLRAYGTGEATVIINDGIYSYSNDISNNPVQIENFISVGYNAITVLYNPPKNGYSSFHMAYNYNYNYWSNIPDAWFFLPNECDVDEFISMKSIMDGLSIMALYTGESILVEEGNSVPLSFKASQDGITIGMDIMFNEYFQHPYCVFHGRGILIMRDTRDTISVYSGVSNDEEKNITEYTESHEPVAEITTGYNSWHHLFIVFDENSTSWCFDMSSCGIKSVRNSHASSGDSVYIGLADDDEGYDTLPYLIERGDARVKNIVIADRMLKYNELNRMYNNREMMS